MPLPVALLSAGNQRATLAKPDRCGLTRPNGWCPGPAQLNGDSRTAALHVPRWHGAEVDDGDCGRGAPADLYARLYGDICRTAAGTALPIHCHAAIRLVAAADFATAGALGSHCVGREYQGRAAAHCPSDDRFLESLRHLYRTMALRLPVAGAGTQCALAGAAQATGTADIRSSSRPLALGKPGWRP